MSDRVTITLDRADADTLRQLVIATSEWDEGELYPISNECMNALDSALAAAPDAPAEPLAALIAECEAKGELEPC